MADRQTLAIPITSTTLFVFGSAVGVAAEIAGSFLPWYESALLANGETVSGIDSGPGVKVLVLAFATIAAAVGLLVNARKNRWLLGVTFSLSALACGDVAQYLTVDGITIREGVWIIIAGAALSATSSAVAFVVSQSETPSSRTDEASPARPLSHE